MELRCSICKSPAVCVMSGDSLCEEHEEQAKAAIVMLRAQNNEEN